MRTAFAAAVLTGLVAASPGVAATRADRCRVPGATVRARSGDAAVLRLAAGPRRWVVCDRRTGRLRGLVEDPEYDEVTGFRLVGHHVAVEQLSDDEAPAAGVASVALVDTRSGAILARLFGATTYALSRRGAVVYAVASSAYPSGGGEVFRLDHRSPRPVLLDGAFGLAVQSLRLRGDTASWTVDGGPRSARLARAPVPVDAAHVPAVRRPRRR